MAARIPRLHTAGTEVVDKCFLSVHTRIPPCLLIKPVSKKKNKWLIFYAWLDPQRGWKSEPFHEDVFFCLFQNVISRYPNIAPRAPTRPKLLTARKKWSVWIKLLWICTSMCPSKCLLCTPHTDCAQTESLQLCLSFCPPKQTPAETQNQSLLQSAIIWNPQGALNPTSCPKKHRWLW